MEIRRLPKNQFLWLKKNYPRKATYLSLVLGSRQAARNRTANAQNRWERRIRNLPNVFTTEEFKKLNVDLHERQPTDTLRNMVRSNFIVRINRGCYRKNHG